jgi:hypothetical protein
MKQVPPKVKQHIVWTLRRILYQSNKLERVGSSYEGRDYAIIHKAKNTFRFLYHDGRHYVVYKMSDNGDWIVQPEADAHIETSKHSVDVTDYIEQHPEAMGLVTHINGQPVNKERIPSMKGVNGWEQWFVMGGYSWQKNNHILQVIKKNEWMVTCQGDYVGQSQTLAGAYKIAYDYMKSH